ncbi:MAG: hypothetical protein NZ700_00345 [Gemmataceae bacterium]|nr:hypothetical protein [Gemmataceae bacterium]MDW8265863.1 hypothetical protein [Gemmataceae bacterium]
MGRRLWEAAVAVGAILTLFPPPTSAQQPDCAPVSPRVVGPWQTLCGRMPRWGGRPNRPTADRSPGATVPLPPTDAPTGGMLLKTGAFQLGPAVGRDLLRSQSDGYWGFWD